VIVVTIGIPRSASTWMYNLVLTLMKWKAGSVEGHYVDMPNSLAALTSDSNDCSIVVKTHVGTHDFWQTIPSDAHFIITTRDIRDGIASSRQMFKSVSFDQAIEYSRAAANFSMQAADQQNALVFKYEDKFFDKLSTVTTVAERLDIPVTVPEAKEILDQLSRESVLKKIRKLQRDGIIGDDSDEGSYDPITHWHPGHIKDGRTGKYLDILSDIEISSLSKYFQDYFQKFYRNNVI